MNRIYKVIYSKARQCAMVVSELAKSSHKKSQKEAGHASTPALARIIATALAAGALTWGIAPGVSWAAPGNDQSAVVFDDKGSLMSTDATINHEHESGYGITNVSKGIALGNHAYVYNQGGGKANAMLFGSPTYTSGIAIGENAYALEDSIDLGNKIYKGAMGDVSDLSKSKYDAQTSSGTGRLLIGNNSYSSGTLSTLIGNHSIMTTNYLNGRRWNAMQNAGAVSIGALNSIESYSSDSNMSGVANSIIGLANKTTNANGALILGAGNEIKNSITSISVSGSASTDVATASQAIRDSMANGYAGGATLIIGGGNKTDYTQNSQIIGVGSSITGTKENPAQFNMLNGVQSHINNSSSVYAIGYQNTIGNSNKSIVVGDYHKLDGGNNNVIIGSMDSVKKTETIVHHGWFGDWTEEVTTETPIEHTENLKDAVMIGHNANATIDGGVALGAGSVAAIDKGQVGYDPANGDHQNDTTGTWKSTAAAVSVGDASKNITRQITNVAAGFNATDAVNVAQLRKLGDNTVQYDLNTKKGKITLAGKDGTTITNVKSALVGAKDANGKDATIATATGADLSNAVNLKDLQDVYNEVNSKADKANSSHTALTVEGGNAAGTEEGSYTGDNILLHATTDATTGKVTYDLKLNNDIMIGNKGKDGVSITGPQGEAGKDGIDGKVGISGKDGKDAVSISGKDGVGHIGLTGPAGTNGMDGADGKPGNSIDITVKNGYNVKGKDGKDGINGENGVDGTSLTRIVYKDATGEHQIATLEDGLKFKGDDEKEISKKLNNTLEIIGGADSTKLTEKNIGVNKTDDGKLKIQLANELNGITSIGNQKTEDGKTSGGKITFGTDSSVNVNGGKITNVGDGTVSADSKDAINGETLYSEVRPTEGKYVSAGKTTAQNLTDLDKQIQSNEAQITNMDNRSVKYDMTADGKSVDKTKITLAGEGGTTIANVKDGSVSKDSKEAVNGGQLFTEQEARKAEDNAINKKIGTLDTTKTYNYIDATKSISENLDNLDTKVKKDITDINNSISTLDQNAVKYDDSTKGQITLGGQDGTKITNVKDGSVAEGSKEAVNGGQLWKVDQKVDNNTTEINKIKNGDFTDASKKAIHNIAKDAVEVVDGLNTKAVKKAEGTDTTPTQYAVNVEGNGKVASGDTGLISGGTLYNEVHVNTDGTYIKSKDSDGKDMTVAQNLSALDKGLKTTRDLIHTNTAGDTIQIGESSNATKIDVSGKDSYGKTTCRVITGVVTDAQDASSAANVGYVNGVTAANTQQIYRDMNSAYGRLNNNINKAAAGSNALAALHPLDYDPDDKADFAVGYGHYRNANAAAVGAFYHPNENTMVNVGVSLGNGDPGFNAGVSFKVGRGGAGHEAMSKTEMAKVINNQSKEIDALKKDNADKNKRIDALEQKMAEILAKLDKNGK